MKCIAITLFVIFLFSGNIIISQPVNHIDGGRYLKTIEYNIFNRGISEEFNNYNLEHKSIVDRIFFGSKNSYIEFVFKDSPEGSNEATAFRINKNLQDDSYKLEVMRLENMAKVYDIEKTILEKTTQILLPFWVSKVIPMETAAQMKDHNKQALIFKINDDLYKPYRPDPEVFVISKELAEKLHRKTSMLIDEFKGKGISVNILDGYVVTFRCVMEDELWTLSIHIPQGKALQLSDLFRQITRDGLRNNIDELEYIKLLDDINL